MLNRSASLAMLTSVLKALPGKFDIKRHEPIILYISCLVAIPDMGLSRQDLYVSVTDVCLPFYFVKLSPDVCTVPDFGQNITCTHRSS